MGMPVRNAHNNKRCNKNIFHFFISYAGITRFRFKGFDLSRCHRDNSTPLLQYA